MMRWRVVCALKVAMEMRSPTSKFINVLFPTLGFPTIFTKPDLCIAVGLFGIFGFFRIFRLFGLFGVSKPIPILATHLPFLVELGRTLLGFGSTVVTPHHV